MKKALKRFISAVLASAMTITGVTATQFAYSSVSVMAATNISVSESKGWFESCYVEWIGGDSSYTGYNAYVKKSGDNNWTQLDNMLIRRYADHWRADAVGLAAGSYDMKVVPVSAGSEITADAITTEGLVVTNYDRSGAAFSTKSKYGSSGAYNTDGTLKDGAKVIYVTPENAKTVKATINYDKGEQEFTGLQAIITALQKGKETAPIDIRIVGMIKEGDMDSFGSSSEGLQIKGKNAYANLNLTIEGIGEDAGIHGFGLLLRNAGNVELRNFAVMACRDDCISIDTDNCNVWVHNMDFFYGKTGGDSDQAKGDGTVDLKGESTNITISYNHFFDSGKSSLCGMKGETTACHITYHHNWFDHSDSRHPRIRTMSVHVYNNYFDGNAKYGVGVTMGSSAFVENNYFRNCKYPMLSSKQGTDATGDGTFSGENGGIIKAYNNHIEGAQAYLTQANPNPTTGYDAYEVSERTAQVPSSEVTKAGGTTYNNFDTSSTFDLGVAESMIDATEDVPAKVMAGAGRLNGGDFKWTFDNATEDANYELITALKSAVVNYTSPVVSFGGNSDGTVVTTAATTTTEATTEITTSETQTETTTQAEPDPELTTVSLNAGSGFDPADITPNGVCEVVYQPASNDYLLKDTSSNAATVWNNGFDAITSGKVVIKGYAQPVISKATSKWAFVQIKGTDKNGGATDIASLASDKDKKVALRTNTSTAAEPTYKQFASIGAVSATKYEYKFVIDIDAQQVSLTVNGETITAPISVESVSSVFNITAKSATDRNLIVSTPVVGVPGSGSVETSTETTTETTTETSTETTTETSTETTTETSTETTTETSTETTTETTTEKALVKGDSDNNGKVEANDAAVLLQKVLTGAKVAIEDATENIMDFLDTDKDGQLTSTDVTIILQKALDSTFKMPNEK